LDVADEGDVGLIKVITQKELEKVKSINTGFGNIEGESYHFDEEDAVEITEDEFKVLKKFGLTDLQFGYCDLSNEELEDDEDDEDDEDYDGDEDDGDEEDDNDEDI